MPFYIFTLWGSCLDTDLNTILRKLSLLSGQLICQMNYSEHEIVYIPTGNLQLFLMLKNDY